MLANLCMLTMKLKIRYGSKTVIVEANLSSTLHSLKCQVLGHVKLMKESDIILSLNKQTALEGDDETLVDLGIVSGDLIHVLNEPPIEQPCHQKSYIEPCSATGLGHMESLSVVNSSTSMDIQSCDACETKSVNAERQFNQLDPDNSNKKLVVNAIVNRYFDEPTLLRESTHEQLPQTVVSSFSLSQPDSSSVALVILIDILMSELGYQLTEGNNHQLKDGTVKLEYKYPLLSDHGFQLVCIPMSGILFIHGFVRQSVNILDKKQLQLKTASYIKELTTDAMTTYRGESLSALSRLFKDAIGYPLLYSALQGCEGLQLPNLSSLVLELQLHILKFLDVASLLRLREVSSRLYEVAAQPILWRRLYAKDFGHKDDMRLTQNWLELYKCKYMANKRLKRCCDTNSQYFKRPYPAFPEPFPLGPSGFFIGGEYDLRPSFTPPPFMLSQLLRPRPVLYAPPSSALNEPFPPSIHQAMSHVMRQSYHTIGPFLR